MAVQILIFLHEALKMKSMIIFTLVLILSSASQAQQILSTSLVGFQQTSGGEPVMCGVEFDVSFIDNVTPRPNVRRARGSIIFGITQGNWLGGGLKIIEETAEGPRRIQGTGSLRVGNQNLSLLRRDADMPEAYFGLFQNNDSFTAMSGILEGFSLRYNLSLGSLDLTFSFARSEILNRSRGIDEYLSCQRSLLLRIAAAQR